MVAFDDSSYFSSKMCPFSVFEYQVLKKPAPLQTLITFELIMQFI